MLLLSTPVQGDYMTTLEVIPLSSLHYAQISPEEKLIESNSLGANPHYYLAATNRGVALHVPKDCYRDF